MYLHVSSISQLTVLVTARVTLYCNKQALWNILIPESCFYDFAIKSYYVYMAPKGHRRHLRISPITFEPDVTQASFKYVRAQQDKTYSLIPDCAPEDWQVPFVCKKFNWFIVYNKISHPPQAIELYAVL